MVNDNYRIFTPKPGLKRAVKKSQLVGDVVASYLKIAKGKRGVTFTDDIYSAEMTAAAFNAAGVPTAAISSKTPLSTRQTIMMKFRAGKLLQLCTCDLFDDGDGTLDVEVVSMTSLTMRRSRFIKQIETASQVDGVTIIIDHANNLASHGLPGNNFNNYIGLKVNGKR